MRNLVFFSFLFFSIQVTAQPIWNNYTRFYPEASTLRHKNHIQLQGDVSLNSTAITNTFFRSFITNKYITNALKDEVSARLKNKNRYGYMLNASLLVNFHKDSLTSYMVGSAEKQHNAAVFSKDDFGLFFRGNKMFAGKDASLSPLHFTSFSYQSIFVGINKTSKSKKLNYWVGISAIRGGSFKTATVENGSFYTEPDGAFIEAKGDFNINLSNGKYDAPPRSSGIGASLFFGADYRMGKSTFGFSVSDLGFIHWKNIKHYSKDSMLQFEGKDIGNLLTFDDSLFTSYNADSLGKDANINITTKKIYYFLPTLLKLNYVHYCSDKFFFITELEIMTQAGFFPRLFIQPVYRVKENLFIHTTLSAGGYGKTDIGFGLAGKIAKGFDFNLNIFAAELLVAPSKTSGQRLSMALVKSF